MRSTGTWGALEPAISGDVILPGSPDYQRTYRALNARFDDVRPHAVVRCGTPQDVAECIHFARQQGMAVATRGGGHCFGGRSSTEGLLVDVTPMHSVGSRAARSRWGEAHGSARSTNRCWSGTSLFLPAPVLRSGSPDWLSVGDSGSSVGSTGLPPTICSGCRSSWRTVGSWSATITTRKTCSGRSEAGARATSGWSAPSPSEPSGHRQRRTST